MKTPHCCLYCDAIQGCPFLKDQGRQFSQHRVIQPDKTEECTGWTPLSGPRQKDVRDRLYEVTGPGSIRVLFSLNDAAASDLKQMEEEEHEMMQTIDLASIIPEGMTVSEREFQLRHLTDEEGNVTGDDDGEPVVRPSYELRNFAISPDYHVKLERDVGLFWSTKQVVDHIIKAELEQGLITKDSKKGSPNLATGSAPTSKPRETKKMAAGKRVILRRGGKGAAPKADEPKKTTGKATTTTGAKKGKTVVKKGKAKGTSPAKAAAPAEEAAAPVGDFDMEALVDALVPRVSEVVENRIKEIDAKLNEVIAYIEDAKAASTDGITLLHDVMAQSIMAMNGNINSLAGNLIKALTEEDAEIDWEPCEIELNGDLFDEDNKILAYIPEEGEGGEDEGNE